MSNILNASQVNSLLKLKAKAEANPNKVIRISDAQFKAMRVAYAALVAANADIPDKAEKLAKELNLV
jgi:hypothetical protein